MGKKILIVEDGEDYAAICVKRFKQGGFDIMHAKNKKETMEIVKIFKADLVLLDKNLNSEEYTGLDLVAGIREYIPDVKIVLLSNQQDSGLRKDVIRHKVDFELLKIEYTPKELVERINEIF